MSDEQAEPPVPVGVAEPTAPPEPAASPKRRPRGRTTLIIAAAAVLGIAAGAAVGFDIQAGRAPTPLAALSQPGLGYPAKALPAGRAPEPLPASQDRRVRADGDLRTLLVPRPAGWRESKDVPEIRDGWITVDDYVRDFENDSYMFGSLLEADIRRVAAAAWTKDEHRVASVMLVQFRAGTAMSADLHAADQRSYMPDPKHGAGNTGDALKGSIDGRYYLYKADREPGYLPLYRARAVFDRGDIMAEVNLVDTEPISKKDIRTLAEQQLERL
ncbi:hypothetical protein [Streptomyces sp. NPDC057682]|uniref:hypothetical protein n=1 Tax=unclassified Streptomyces TaxID=2593676 RepID=UPI00365D4D1A